MSQSAVREQPVKAKTRLTKDCKRARVVAVIQVQEKIQCKYITSHVTSMHKTPINAEAGMDGSARCC